MVKKRKRSLNERIKAKDEQTLSKDSTTSEVLSYRRKISDDYSQKIAKVGYRFQDKIHNKNLACRVERLSRKNRKRNYLIKKELEAQDKGKDGIDKATAQTEENSGEHKKKRIASLTNAVSERSNQGHSSTYRSLGDSVRHWSYRQTMPLSKRKPSKQHKRFTRIKETETGLPSVEYSIHSSKRKRNKTYHSEIRKPTSHFQEKIYRQNITGNSYVQGNDHFKRIRRRRINRQFYRKKHKNQTLNREFEPIKSVLLPEEEIRNFHKRPQVDKKEIRKRNIQKEKQRNLSNRTNEINSFSKRNSNKETMDVKTKVVKTQKTSPGFQNVFEKSTKEDAGKNRKSRKRKNQKKAIGFLGATQVASAGGIYLSYGSEENQGVEAAEKTLRTASTFLKGAKKYATKHKEKRFESLSSLVREKSRRKIPLTIRNIVDKRNKLIDSKKIARRKKFQKKKQMKEAIKNSFSNSLKERIKKSLLEGINFTKQFISKRAKGIAIATVVIFGFGMILFQFTSVSMSGVANSTSGVLATSYLSSEQILKGINQIFSKLETDLYNELENVQSHYPGYDEYIIHKHGDIGHNVHELLSYITSRYGEIKNLSDIKAPLKGLFDTMYKVNYRVETETRYRTVTDSQGNESKEAYLYKKLIVTLDKTEMDTIVHKVFANYPDNLKHYQSLFSAQGNMADLFSNRSLLGGNGGGSVSGAVGGGKEYEASDAIQKSIVNAAYITPSPGPGWCAMWVTQVYQNAGIGFIGGNANDMYRNFTYTSDRSKLKVGMIVAVESCSTGGELGRTYGHVGIYIGDGKVMDNIGQIRVTSLDNWIATCCQSSPVGFGFPPNVQR